MLPEQSTMCCLSFTLCCCSTNTVLILVCLYSLLFWFHWHWANSGFIFTLWCYWFLSFCTFWFLSLFEGMFHRLWYPDLLLLFTKTVLLKSSICLFMETFLSILPLFASSVCLSILFCGVLCRFIDFTVGPVDRVFLPV